MSVVISIERVSKSYRLGMIGGATLKDDFARWWAKVRGQPDPLAAIGAEHHARQIGEEFWALQDVSFDVHEGQVMAIVGRNGAGKSTLLKILSQVTAPTSGEIKIKGRIASLLEVGTGFHPELTGRENVFLNGAILGMTKAEIRRKFDEIVAFSEIETFIDTPVKRYSSGMYVRLAFAVAAHLDPEILIVDEVLAVGDAEFQKKCLGKIREVGRSGRTVLFVSHNVNAVSTLCTEAAVLRDGELIFAGDVREALTHYGASTEVEGSIDFTRRDRSATLRKMEMRTDGEVSDGTVKPLQDVTLDFAVNAQQLLRKPMLSVGFTNAKGDRVFAVASYLGPKALPPIDGSQMVRIAFEMPPVVPGKYALDIGFYDNDAGLHEEYYSAGTIEVAEINFLQMVNPNADAYGQFHVRSSCMVLTADGRN
jgi:lipopolysaccharide transport system ATP-binding protein